MFMNYRIISDVEESFLIHSLIFAVHGYGNEDSYDFTTVKKFLPISIVNNSFANCVL